MPRLTDTQRNNAIGHCKQKRLNKPWPHTLVFQDTLSLRCGHVSTTLKVPMTGLGKVDPKSPLRPRIVTSGSAIFGIAPRQQHRQHPKSLNCEEFPIKLFATASEKQDFWPEDQCDGTR
ncbi:hypothetical protein BaRGS_00026932 [Batillaria attramentaria]|uniref:Uncharacterized protein n=1 Tax=Batillaria attramentaria TaxID=370345 RepID=A0ABD0K4D5_9CAEN